MKLPFQPCVNKKCRWGGWLGKKWACCCDPAQYGMCSSGGDRPKKNAAVAQNTSTNTGSPKLLLVLDQALNLINDGEWARAEALLRYLRQQLRAGA